MTSVNLNPRTKLAASIRDSLLERINTSRPGALLPSERKLMEEFAVGRPAIREALQSLEAAGLIEIRHGGGARVAEPSIGRTISRIGDTMKHLLINSAASLEHLKELRVTLEMEMAHIAARRRTPADVARLAAALDLQAAAREDSHQFRHFDGSFHREIASISGNPLYAALVESIFQWLSDFYRSQVIVPGLESLTLQEHKAILEAIEAGDANAAARLMHAHITRANELYRRSNIAATPGASTAGSEGGS